jgi:hypothetical protein
MSGGIFLLDPAGELTEMAETAFAAEVDLQKLLADHPGLLPGDQIDPGAPRRWLLVSREVGIPDQDQGGARWALDHLFLDQDGVPTLVEVKRGTDPRTRREVVGQMLDYAANCILHWTAESIQGWLARRCQEEGDLDPDEQIAHLLGEPAATGDFWQRVKTNLKAGKIRLLFVSDAIPPELRRIVEFLNEQMDPAEVLAVEIRQYAGKDLKTLVPRVLGQTTQALVRKGEERKWDEPTFFADLTRRTGEEEAQVARRILDWAKDRGCWIWWGKGAKDGSFFPMVRHGEMDLGRSPSGPMVGLRSSSSGCGSGRPSTRGRSGWSFSRSSTRSSGWRFPRMGIERRPSVPLRLLVDGGAGGEVLGWLGRSGARGSCTYGSRLRYRKSP